jgi:hypothetical protein
VVAQRLSRTGKRRVGIGLALFLLVVFTAGIVLGPQINESKEDEQARLLREETARAERETKRIRAEQRPVSAIVPPGPKAAMATALAERVLRDARARVENGTLKGPARSSSCAPYPRTSARAAEERDGARRRGAYECTVATRKIAILGRTGALGHPFLAVIDYRSGRITWCKVNPPPGEGVAGQAHVRVPLDPSCTKA